MRIGFLDFELDTERYLLKRAGRPVALRPKVFDLLIHLAENRHRVVSREELVGRLWSQTSVGAGSLSGLVNELRRALGESGEAPAAASSPRTGRESQGTLRTVHARGYQFVAATRVLGEVLDKPNVRGRGALEDLALRAGASVGTGLPKFHAALMERWLARMSQIEGSGARGLLIEGPTGSGKSRLLDELMVGLADHGFVILRVSWPRFEEEGEALASTRFAEAFRDALIERWVAPDPVLVRPSLSPSSAASALEARQHQGRVRAALVRWMRALSESGPLAFVIEGRAANIEMEESWLAGLLGQIEAAPILIVRAIQTTGVRTPLVPGGFRLHPRVEVARLGALDSGALAEVFLAEGLPPLPHPLAAWLIEYATSPAAPIDRVVHWLKGHQDQRQDHPRDQSEDPSRIDQVEAPNRQVRSVQSDGLGLRAGQKARPIGNEG